MKSRDALLRLKRFQADERRRRVAQIESMVAEFSRMATDLDREIANEETRSGISDPGHFAYSTYAKASRARRDNLKLSAGELHGQLAEAKRHFDEAAEELAKVQNLDGREKAAEGVRDRADMEALGLRAARA